MLGPFTGFGACRPVLAGFVLTGVQVGVGLNLFKGVSWHRSMVRLESEPIDPFAQNFPGECP